MERNETKHTPGRAEGARVLSPYSCGTVECCGIAECFHGSQPEIAEANARLIAAAPTLLEALLRCKFDSLNMSLDDLNFCRAAIALATSANLKEPQQ